MVQALPTPVTFDQFINWHPESSEHRYELHRGRIIEMPSPTGKHSRVSGFITAELNFEIRNTQQPYFIPKECVVLLMGSQVTHRMLSFSTIVNLSTSLDGKKAQ